MAYLKNNREKIGKKSRTSKGKAFKPVLKQSSVALGSLPLKGTGRSLFCPREPTSGYRYQGLPLVRRRAFRSQNGVSWVASISLFSKSRLRVPLTRNRSADSPIYFQWLPTNDNVMRLCACDAQRSISDDTGIEVGLSLQELRKKQFKWY